MDRPSAQGTGLRKRDCGIGDLLILHDEMFHGEPKDKDEHKTSASAGVAADGLEVTVDATLRPSPTFPDTMQAPQASQASQASQRALFSDGLGRKVEGEDFSTRLRKRLEDAVESTPDRSISHEFGSQTFLGSRFARHDSKREPVPLQSHHPIRESTTHADAPGEIQDEGPTPIHTSEGQGISSAPLVSSSAEESSNLVPQTEQSRVQLEAVDSVASKGEATAQDRAGQDRLSIDGGESSPRSDDGEPVKSADAEAEADEARPRIGSAESEEANEARPRGSRSSILSKPLTPSGRRKNKLMLQLPGAMPQLMVGESERQDQVAEPVVLETEVRKPRERTSLQSVDEESPANDSFSNDGGKQGPKQVYLSQDPLKSILKKSKFHSDDGSQNGSLNLRTAAMVAGLAARARQRASKMSPPVDVIPSKRVTIVDKADEMKEKRRSQKEVEWKERQQKMNTQRRLKAIGSVLKMPIGMAIHLGKCYLASPKARQVWLVAILSVCLFELWSAALFIAFTLDQSKARFLSTLLSMDHYANLVFIIDAMFLALNEVAGDSQEMSEMSDTCLKSGFCRCFITLSFVLPIL